MTTERIKDALSILRRKDVERKVGLSRSQIYALQKLGQFPKSIPLSSRAVGWLAGEIEAWLAERAASRASSI